jgi:TolB protein
MMNSSYRATLGVAACVVLAATAGAQNQRVSPRPRPQRPVEVPPAVVVLPVDTTAGDSIRVIIERDLDYGDRVQPVLLDSAMADDVWRPNKRNINFGPLRDTRAKFAVRARPISTGLRVEIYDVAREKLLQAESFRLPRIPRDSVLQAIGRRDLSARDSLEREWRLAIHSVSDEIERWITGTRGTAATRIVYIDHGKLKIVDSDGANVQILPTAGAALSPSWHPSGRYIVYVEADDRGTRIAQYDLRTMKSQLLPASPRGLNIGPVYTRDGKSIVWASGMDKPAELLLASANGNDTTAKRFVGRTGFETTSPTFSPDGRQVAFISPRPLTPQVYIMNVDGTRLRLLTPVVAGKRSYRTSPDWSPNGEEVAFMQQMGDFQIWTISVRDRVMRQLTTEGENEDPSWAPDGRHLSITTRRGDIGDDKNIWVLDTRTGRMRQLTHSNDARLSDWSPRLKPNF